MDEKQTEWRGKIQHIGSGEARYFRDWSRMQEFIDDVLEKLPGHHRKDLYISPHKDRFPALQLSRMTNYLNRRGGDRFGFRYQTEKRKSTSISGVLTRIALVIGFVVIALVSYVIGWHQFGATYSRMAGALPQKEALFMGAFQVFDKLNLHH